MRLPNPRPAHERRCEACAIVTAIVSMLPALPIVIAKVRR